MVLGRGGQRVFLARARCLSESFTSNSMRNHLRVSDLQLFDLIGALLNFSEEQMPIRMF